MWHQLAYTPYTLFKLLQGQLLAVGGEKNLTTERQLPFTCTVYTSQRACSSPKRMLLWALDYRIALNFRGSLISRILQIFNHARKYFSENFWHAACSVRMQRIREIIPTKFSKIASCENLDSKI